MPHPVTGEPLGQAEKDKIGQQQREAAEREETRQHRRQTRGRWANDEQLDDLEKDRLLQEAELRRVDVKTSASKPDIVKALRAASAELDKE
jgi:hypothetical protein